MIVIESAFASDPGRQRENNEDSVWAQVTKPPQAEAFGLFIVCDGIGGYRGGENASYWAVEAIKSQFQNLLSASDPLMQLVSDNQEMDRKEEGNQKTRASEINQLEKLTRKAVENANRIVYESARQANSDSREAGTTIALAAILGNRGVFANVGDSRVYLLRDGNLRQITTDHSLVAALVKSKQITPDEAFNHPQRNLILRSLGNKPEVEVDTFVELLKPDDVLLLCSDGLWEMIQDESIIATLIDNNHSLQQACDALISAANNAGGVDNISVVLARLT